VQNTEAIGVCQIGGNGLCTFGIVQGNDVLTGNGVAVGQGRPGGGIEQNEGKSERGNRCHQWN
jgi:hypothetical protein